MKSMTTIVVIAAFISIGATALIPRPVVQDSDSAPWRQLLEHDVSMYTAERGPLDGAPGASVIAFRVNDAVQGGAIITGLDRPALGVFVGLNTPNAFINAPYRDLRVEFTLADGSSRRVAPAGGGGTAMLFHSPDDLPMSNIRKVALYVDETAEWAK